MNRNNISTGNAGEYFVAGELERHGYTVAVPMSNTKDFDILAINRKNNQHFAIQVKTTSQSAKRWTLNKKNEKLFGNTIFYVFVSLKGLDNPEYHIVPSKIVADYIRNGHKKWLSTPGKNGQKHNDTDRRTFIDKDDEYLNNWECLNY